VDDQRVYQTYTARFMGDTAKRLRGYLANESLWVRLESTEGTDGRAIPDGPYLTVQMHVLGDETHPMLYCIFQRPELGWNFTDVMRVYHYPVQEAPRLSAEAEMLAVSNAATS
jgi:hypothetical protein